MPSNSHISAPAMRHPSSCIIEGQCNVPKSVPGFNDRILRDWVNGDVVQPAQIDDERAVGSS